MARALANGPRLLLADEPTGNLDSRTSREIVGLLAGLNRDRGLTVVMVSHEEALVREFAARDRAAPGRPRRRDGEDVDESPGTPSSSPWPACGKRRLRTFLTASGVMIGIGALVSMISFGKGMQKNVTASLRGLGPVQRRSPCSPAAPKCRGPIRTTGGRSSQAVRRAGRRPRRRGRGRRSPGSPGVAMAYPGRRFPGHGPVRRRGGVPARPGHPGGGRGVSGPSRSSWGRAYASDDEEGVIVSRTILRRLAETRTPAAAVGRTVRITIGRDRFRQAGDAQPRLRSSRGESFPVTAGGVRVPGRRRHRASRPSAGRAPLTESDVLIPPGIGPADQAAAVHERLGPLPHAGGQARLFGASPSRLGSLRDRRRRQDARSASMGFATFALADQFDEVTTGLLFHGHDPGRRRHDRHRRRRARHRQHHGHVHPRALFGRSGS